MKPPVNNSKNNTKVYNAGIYLRLSREDEENISQSQSIVNQKDFLTRYAIENCFKIADYYIDDGYSGTNFDRPEFQRMIADIEKGRINAVITKDLSRLGRDYIETGRYLEKYFPSKKVRYIAVNDNIDTYEDNGNNDMTPFKAVINDMYAKDISKKVRTAMTTKKLNGEFIGSVAPYGYIKDPNNKNKLIIDVETAPIVQRIFKMFIENPSIIGIAKIFSAEKIPTPSEYKNLTATQKTFKGVWNDVMIKRILTNPTYIGNLTQNRSKKVNYKVDKQYSLPKEDWIIIDGTHEPVISKEDFDIVQLLLTTRNYIKEKKGNKSSHLLSGLVFCSDCKVPMTYSSDSRTGRTTYLVCSTCKKHGRLKLCTPRNIREDVLEKQVVAIIRELAEKYISKDDLRKNADSNTHEDIIDTLNGQKINTEKQLQDIKKIIMNLYKDKVRKIISENDFIEMSKEFNLQRDNLIGKLDSINKEISQNKSDTNTDISIETYLEKFLKFEDIDRAILVNSVDKIEVQQDKTVLIKFNFTEP